MTLRNNIAHSNAALDFDVARPFDEAYFCTGMTGVNPTGCLERPPLASATVTDAVLVPPPPFTSPRTAACTWARTTGSAASWCLPWPLRPGQRRRPPVGLLERGRVDELDPRFPRGLQLPVGRIRRPARLPAGWATRMVGGAVGARYYVRRPPRGATRILAHREADRAGRRERRQPLQPRPRGTALYNSTLARRRGDRRGRARRDRSARASASSPPPTCTSSPAASPRTPSTTAAGGRQPQVTSLPLPQPLPSSTSTSRAAQRARAGGPPSRAGTSGRTSSGRRPR